MDPDEMEAVAATLGGVLAWTNVSEDPMVEEVVQAVVMRVERHDELIALMIGDPDRPQIYVMKPSAWAALKGGSDGGQEG